MPPIPDVTSKLAAPVKKSVFERQKAEAEAKKAREKAETAAVLEDFVKSFDDEGDQPAFPSKRPGVGGASVNNNYGPGPGKRHFTSSGLKSGPGSLGPVPSTSKSGPGSLGPVPNYGKKRQYEDYAGRDRDRRDRMFSYSDERDGNNRRDSGTFSNEEEDARDDGELKAAAKPTLHLSSLPPGTSPAVIKSLFTPSPLTIENVRILPAGSGSINERKSVTAIVTLAAETPATDIDTMVSHLQNRYLGFGFNLSISRHLSSAALTGSNSLSNNTPHSNLNSLPFGAKPIPQHTSLSRAPPPGQGPGRFAPPASFTSSTPYGPRSNNLPATQVLVQAPRDLQQLRLIHKTVEALLTYGPEFEALLMSRPQIQRAEQWAWLWNSRSTGGVYYRWRLWEILTNAIARRRRQPTSYGMRQSGDVLFEGQSIWVPPEENLKFEYTTKLEEFISDEDYNSSDEEDAEDGGGLARRYHDHQKLAGNPADSMHDNDGAGYLNPLAKTKLVHLLSRLPESNTKLRKGDVARVTGFAIGHAGAGADEVATLVTRNVIKPFCYSVIKAEKARHPDDEGYSDDEIVEGSKPKTDDAEKEKDTTPASMVGLYIISDILSSSASAGVRHAWRYRSLFETQLRLQNVFPILGRAARENDWGKLKAEKWRRSVQSVLSLWEGWCVFPGKSHEEFVEGFLHPPLTEKEIKEHEAKKGRADRDSLAKEEKDKPVNRWRSVDDANASIQPDEWAIDSPSMLGRSEDGADGDADVDMDVDGTPMADDDEEYGDDDLTDAGLDGIPMLDSSDEDEAEDKENAPEKDATDTGIGIEQDPPSPANSEPASQTNETVTTLKPPQPAPTPTTTSPMSQGRRVRPKAADFDDMFE
ncbi:uncharacterized protein Z518_06567 [Rhinocladiella mackenziei CBS 650.93]|uniref:CID domain-containing protein n=1 Tax=Rhinocladiella mackenziei CBS 650.93 TaxID=1442369 RepID=A0A0D2FM51_9EURO|nr:uncharacterized protein Z518_06567 [Rhinocladiella mackenziei CBS 650.93]KIX03017.1 hypothetical protein Z518_06567 [Rhinocladiella mackenziei CBS 650.93]